LKNSANNSESAVQNYEKQRYMSNVRQSVNVYVKLIGRVK